MQMKLVFTKLIQINFLQPLENNLQATELQT